MGWGPPPAYQWADGPPRPFNYYGYDVNPVWDQGFNQWGIWLFGLWIPIFGIGSAKTSNPQKLPPPTQQGGSVVLSRSL